MRSAILAALTIGLIPVVAQAQTARCVPGVLLVVYAESATANRKLTVQSEHGLSLLSASPSVSNCG